MKRATSSIFVFGHAFCLLLLLGCGDDALAPDASGSDVQIADDAALGGDDALTVSDGGPPPDGPPPDSFVLVDGAAGTDAGPLVPADFFVSPDGDDALAGTTPATAKRTLAALAGLLGPGDVVEIADGTYTNESCGDKGAPCFNAADALPRINCRGGWSDGTEGLPIVIRAANERRVLFDSDGSTEAFSIENCSYYTIEGLHFRGGDFSATQKGPFRGTNNDHLTLRRVLGQQSNRCVNAHVIFNEESRDLLIEESECYQFHRHCFIAWRSSNVTYRRNYVHSREYNSAAAGAACDPPYTATAGAEPYGGEGMSCYNSGSCIYENNIVEQASSAFSTHADGVEGAADDNLFVGNIAIDSRGSALQIDSRCRGNVPCPNSRIAERNRLENFVVVDSPNQGTASTSNGKINLIATQDFEGRGITLLNVSRATEINCGWEQPSWHCNGIPCSNTDVSLTNYLSFNNGEGATVRTSASHGTIGTWTFNYANSVSNGVDFAPADFSCPNCFDNRSSVVPLGMYDPDSGRGCKVYIPGGNDGRGGTNPPVAVGEPGAGLASNMAGAGEEGDDIGANIVFRMENGVVTDHKLWDQTTGAFPCGAIVAGVNDIAGTSCFDVHERLNVGNNGCDIP